MSSSLFKISFEDSPLRGIFSNLVTWSKAFAILGLIFQLMMAGFAVLHFRRYELYQAGYPKTAQLNLMTAGWETLQTIVYSTIYVLGYQVALRLQKAISGSGNERGMELAFKRNLQLVKVQFFVIVLTMFYYGYMLYQGIATTWHYGKAA